MEGRGMKVRRFRTAQRAADALALEFAAAIRERPTIVLGLPTGLTPVPVYDALIALHRSGLVDFSQTRIFNLDEFVGISGDDPGSYRAFMQRHLFDHVNVSRRQQHFLNGVATDVEQECRRYERALHRAGGLELLLLGIGVNGHVGFNEPAESLQAAAHEARLRPSTRRANRHLFGNRLALVPRSALSLGMAAILQARRIVLLATGVAKAHAVAQAVSGPITPQVPASLLQLHGNVSVWVDDDAALRLGRSRGVSQE